MFDSIYQKYLDELEFTPEENIYVEIWIYEKDVEPECETGILREDLIGEWLRKDRPVKDGASPTGGLRLIIAHPRAQGTVGLRKLPFSRSDFEDVIETFQIPKTFPKALYYESAHFAKFGMGPGETRSTSIAFILRTLNYDSARYGLAVTHDTATNTVQGLIHGVLEGWETQRLLTAINDMRQFAAHPLLIPLFVSELATELSEVGIDASDHVMMRLEYETGQHPYFEQHKDPLSIDFVPVTRRLNSNSTEVGIFEMRTEQMLLLFNDFDETNDDLEKSVAAYQSLENVESGQAARELIQYLRSCNKNLLLRIKHIQRKTQTQLAVVYNFIAQRDNRLNIEVARDSKAIAAASRRDSSSMKTIAVLTIAFLPGTYISSLFAMPLFDWQAAGSDPVLTRRFWIYWAVTIPLTVMVIAIWFTWIKRKMGRHAREDEAAGISDQSLFPKADGKDDEENPLDSDATQYWLNSFAIGKGSAKDRSKKGEIGVRKGTS